MSKDGIRRPTTIRKHMRMLVMALALAVVAAMSMASAAVATPKGEFAVFATCPVSNPETKGCLVAKTESGEFIIGNQTVPITKTLTLQGGFSEDEETGALTFIGATDGNTLSKTPQKVPGGLLGLIKCTDIKGEGFFEKGARAACEAVFENGLTGVNATTELAAPASSIGLNEFALLTATGTALSLPVKIRLENPLLGSACYIGSNASPVVLNLTSGTTAPPLPNKPIKGKVGTLESNEEGDLLTIAGNTLVNNSFAAPGVTGCGGIFGFILNPIINSKIGLPAASGRNTAILNNTIKQAGAQAVRNHE